MKNTKFWIIGVSIIILAGMGYYSYKKDNHVRNKGVYSLAYVNDIKLVMNGWKVLVTYSYNGMNFTGEGINDIKDFSLRSKSKRFFVKFSESDPDGTHILIPVIEVPDSIDTAPLLGWNEQWMKEHFPRVVEYVHDTR